MKLKYIPNIISIIRLILIIPIVLNLLDGHYQLAFLYFVIAGISDGVDGFLARKFAWSSRIGAIIDPCADKLLILSSYICLTWLQLIPMWLFIAVMARDIWIVLGAIAYHFFIGPYDFGASYISKANTFLQVVLIALLLFNLAFTKLPHTLFTVLFFIVLVTTVASFIDYTWYWGRRALLSCRTESSE
jgi:cardiolipin synthase